MAARPAGAPSGSATGSFRTAVACCWRQLYCIAWQWQTRVTRTAHARGGPRYRDYSNRAQNCMKLQGHLLYNLSIKLGLALQTHDLKIRWCQSGDKQPWQVYTDTGKEDPHQCKHKLLLNNEFLKTFRNCGTLCENYVVFNFNCQLSSPNLFWNVSG